MNLCLQYHCSIPTEVCSGLQIIRPDLKTMHEEADVIIPNQVVYLASLGCCTIKVISDDTDVFVLLVHYYADKKLDINACHGTN